MKRRDMLALTGWGVAGFAVGTAFTAPACDGVSKDKAVRYAGLTIDYLKDILPLVAQLGGTEMANLINKAVPLLEKLKAALEKSDISVARNFFDTVTGIISQINKALSQLAESPTKVSIMAILAIVNISLRTVQLFIAPGSSADPTAMIAGPSGAQVDGIRKAFDATRF